MVEALLRRREIVAPRYRPQVMFELIWGLVLMLSRQTTKHHGPETTLLRPTSSNRTRKSQWGYSYRPLSAQTQLQRAAGITRYTYRNNNKNIALYSYRHIYFDFITSLVKFFCTRLSSCTTTGDVSHSAPLGGSSGDRIFTLGRHPTTTAMVNSSGPNAQDNKPSLTKPDG